MSTTAIPAPLVEAAASILQPYGVNLPELLKLKEAAAPLTPLEKVWLSTEEVMHYTGLSRATVTRAAKAGKIIARKMSSHQQGRILFQKASIDNWLQTYRTLDEPAPVV